MYTIFITLFFLHFQCGTNVVIDEAVKEIVNPVKKKNKGRKDTQKPREPSSMKYVGLCNYYVQKKYKIVKSDKCYLEHEFINPIDLQETGHVVLSEITKDLAKVIIMLNDDVETLKENLISILSQHTKDATANLKIVLILKDLDQSEKIISELYNESRSDKDFADFLMFSHPRLLKFDTKGNLLFNLHYTVEKFRFLPLYYFYKENHERILTESENYADFYIKFWVKCSFKTELGWDFLTKDFISTSVQVETLFLLLFYPESKIRECIIERKAPFDSSFSIDDYKLFISSSLSLSKSLHGKIESLIKRVLNADHERKADQYELFGGLRNFSSEKCEKVMSLLFSFYSAWFMKERKKYLASLTSE